MDAAQKGAIQRTMVLLTADMDVTLVLPYLVEGEIFTMDDKERVEVELMSRSKRSKLVDILVRKGPKAYKIFMNAMKATHKHIYSEIRRKETENGSEFKQREKSFVDKVKTHISDAYEVTIDDETQPSLHNVRDQIVRHFSTLDFDTYRVFFQILTADRVKGIIETVFPEMTQQIGSDRPRKGFRETSSLSVDSGSTFLINSNTQCLSQTVPKEVMETVIVERPQNEAATSTSDPAVILKFGSWNIEQVSSWLKTLEVSAEIIDEFKREGVTGEILADLSDNDLKKEFPTLGFGFRRTIIKRRNEMLVCIKEGQSSSDVDDLGPSPEYCSVAAPLSEGVRNDPVKMKSDIPRRFDAEPKYSDKYTYKAVFPNPGLRIDNLLNPIHYFSLGNGSDMIDLESMVVQTAKFTSACLNDRTNGTLHFGIDPKSHAIFGLVLSIEEMSKIVDIPRALNKLFYDEQHDIIVNCIRPPKIIPVIKSGAESYVVEIDICPSFVICKENAFFVKLPAKKVKKKVKYGPRKLYRFEDSNEPHEVIGDELFAFMETKSQLAQLRHEREQARLKPPVDPLAEGLHDKFVDLLCQGDDIFRGGIDVYPILILGKPDKDVDQKALKRSFEFLKFVEWKAIYDFDPDGFLCDFAQKELGMAVSIVQVEAFDKRSQSNIQQPEKLKELQDTIKSSTYPCWIFVNGYTPAGSDALSTYGWKRYRHTALKESVQFFGGEIPYGRAVLMFALLSKDYEIMLESADEITSAFKDQWMAVAETESIGCPWMKEMVHRHCTDSEERQIVTGMLWEQVNDTIKRLCGPRRIGNCELPSSTGAFVEISERMKADLSDIDILSSMECDNTEIANNAVELEKYKYDQEHYFYKGGEVSWWNFWFHTHVLPRENLAKLRNIVSSKLRGSSANGNFVQNTFLYHEPGSGGTTMAKNVLWDLRKEYRCAIITSISVVASTCEQIMNFRKYKDHENPRPVLLLADNLDEEKLNMLRAELEEKSKHTIREQDNDNMVVCVLLICKRRSEKPRNLDRYIFVKHELQQRENVWFEQKAKELEGRYTSGITQIKPKHLISFNIMKEGFNPDFIDKTVRELTQALEDKKERLLLKYVALMNSFDLDFNPLPTAAFDMLMTNAIPYAPAPRRGPGAYASRWESKLSPQIRILLNESTRPSMGHVHHLRLTNQLLSRGILKVLTTREAMSECALTFMRQREIFGFESIASKELIKIWKDVLKKRQRVGPFDLKSHLFSPIMNHILKHESVDKAAEVLQAGAELTGDPFISQQLARVYIQAQNWKLALEHARKATELKHDNSYLWDTYGRIYQRQLQEKYRQLIQDPMNHPLVPENVIEMVRMCLAGKHKFKKVQETSELEKFTISNNSAGYHGELQIVICLLNCLTYVSCFRERDTLRKFLVHPTYVPLEMDCLKDVEGINLITSLKNLHKDVQQTLNRIEDETLQLKAELMDDVDKERNMNQITSMIQLKEDLNSYFGEDQDEDPDDLSDMEVNLYRQRRIFKRAGHNLWSIFEPLRRARTDVERKEAQDNLKQVRKLAMKNIQSTNVTAEDFFYAISVNLALVSMSSNELYNIDFKSLVEWSRKLYELRDTIKVIRLEAYLFFVMFNWPRKNSIYHETPNVINEALRLWRDAYHRKYRRQQEEGKPYRKKDTTKFFLANGSEIRSVISHDELKEDTSTNKRTDMEFWESSKVLRELQRFTGTLLPDGMEVRINLEYGTGNIAPISIPTSFPIRKRTMWNKRVFFFIGFSWVGPKAFDVREEDPTVDNPGLLSEGHRVKKPNEYAASLQGHSRKPNPTTHSEFEMRTARIRDELAKIKGKRQKISKHKQKELDLEENKLLSEMNELIERRERALFRNDVHF